MYANKKIVKNILIVVAIILVGLAGYLIWNSTLPSEKKEWIRIWTSSEVKNFEECVNKGYIVSESYPRQCRTPDGKRFIEEITENPLPENRPITISGEITCLTKTGKGSQTMECAIGLKGDDGRYYGLKDVFNLDPGYKFSNYMRVEVSGMFNKKEANNNYDMTGVIDVTSIKEVAENLEKKIPAYKTFQDSHFNFQFEYPSEWEMRSKPNNANGLNFSTAKIAEGMLPIMDIESKINLSLMGVTYCGAYPQDKRCESLKTESGGYVTIDWDANGKANAMFSSADGKYGTSFALHIINPETKNIFRKILSTFKFIK